MSPLLQKVLEHIDRLTLDEQFAVLNHTMEQLKQRTLDRPKHRWLDIAGTAVYPLVAEDAQDWVTHARQEDQAYRATLLEEDGEA